MKKIGQFILCIVPFICALLIQVIVSVLASIIYGMVQGMKLASQGETDTNVIAKAVTESLTPEVLLIISILAAVVCIPIFGLWYKRLVKNEKSRNLKSLFTIKNVLSIVLLGVALQVGISIIVSSIESIQPEWFETHSKVMDILGGGSSFLSLIYLGLIAPINEEFICRGVVFTKSRKVMPFMAANILQALLFGILHMNLVQGIYGFVMGLFFGFIYMKTKSIIGSILLHMAVNISGVILEKTLTNEIFNMPIMLVIMFILSVVAIIFSMKFIHVNDNVNAETELIIGAEN